MPLNILVTGGAGYIGSNTCAALMKSGYDVIIADNFSNSKPEVLEQIEWVTGKRPMLYPVDIRDTAALDRIFGENSIDAVMHFAGYKAVGESVKDPLKYYHNNLFGAVTLLQAMKKHGCKRFVFSSSATVYGPHNPIPYTEDMPRAATNPYGQTKIMVEEMLEDIAAADAEWSVVLLRYFNPIGSHESGYLGDDPNGIPNNLMPYIARVAAGELSELHVFGSDYDTADGTGVRDYIHVTDLAQGHIRALEYALGHTGAEAVNLGTGCGTSVLQLVKCFEKVNGRAVPYVIDDRRAGDLPEFYADAAKAERLFGWRAQRGIEEMCRDAWRWQTQNPNGYED